MLHIKEGFSGEYSIVLPPAAIEMQQNDPLVSSLYITDIGYYPNADHHFRERKDAINSNVLIYCVEGNGFFRTGKNTFPVKSNQYFILPAGTPHAYWSDEKSPWTIYWIHFSGKHASYYINDTIMPIDVRPGLTSRISDRNKLFEELFYTLKNGYDKENLRYASSLLHYYLGSMRFIQQYRTADDKTSINNSSTIITAAIHYMNENIERKLQLDELASYLGYSISYVSSLFKAEKGQSPLNYFNTMKMERACQFLSETDMHINQICNKVGIDDCYYFSRLFKKMVGVSPKEYRINHK